MVMKHSSGWCVSCIFFSLIPFHPHPIHPFFLKQEVSSNKAATPSGKSVPVNTVTPSSVSNKCQGKNPTTTKGKAELSLSKKAKPSQSQTRLAKPAGILKHKENSKSSSSSDSEEEEEKVAAVATPIASKQIPQPGKSPGLGADPEETFCQYLKSSQSYPHQMMSPVQERLGQKRSSMAICLNFGGKNLIWGGKFMWLKKRLFKLSLYPDIKWERKKRFST